MSPDEHDPLETGCAPLIHVTDSTGARVLLEWAPGLIPGSSWRHERPAPPRRF
jgi:hypothetical protein